VQVTAVGIVETGKSSGRTPRPNTSTLKVSRMRIPRFATLASTAFALAGGTCATLDGVMEGLDGLAETTSARTAPVALQGSIIPAAEDVVAFGGEQGIFNQANVLQCGQTLACVDGWDLRVVNVSLPASRLPAAEEALVEVEIQNRGREQSHASEVQLCRVGSGSTRGTHCGESLGLVTLPPMRSGETTQLRQLVRLPSSEGDHRIRALIDPDGATVEVDRDNNVGTSESFSTERPGLQWLSFDAGGPYRRPGPIIVNFEVRNESFAAATDSIEVQPSKHGGGLSHLQETGYRFVIPPLGPRETYSGSVTLRNAIRPGVAINGNRRFNLSVDPDRRQEWTNRSGRHTRSVRLTFDLRCPTRRCD